MATIQTLPKWSTPERKLQLASILTDYLASIRGWQFDLITGECYNLDYEARIKLIIADWKRLDREQDRAEWEAERNALHRSSDRRYPVRGQFSATSKDIYADNQPLYYLDGQAVSGLTLTPFVRVRLSSSYMRLYVDLGEALRQASKSQRRKAIRYGKALPKSAKEAVTRKVLEAVRDYYSH